MSERSGHALENLSGLASEGRETPVVPDHKAAVAPPAGNFQNVREFVFMNCERFLDEHVLASFERGRREPGMRVVPSGNEHRIDRRVRQDIVRVGRVGTEAKFLAHAFRGDPARGHHGDQITSLPRERDEEFLREAAGADEANAGLLPRSQQTTAAPVQLDASRVPRST